MFIHVSSYMLVDLAETEGKLYKSMIKNTQLSMPFKLCCFEVLLSI